MVRSATLDPRPLRGVYTGTSAGSQSPCSVPTDCLETGSVSVVFLEAAGPQAGQGEGNVLRLYLKDHSEAMLQVKLQTTWFFTEVWPPGV